MRTYVGKVPGIGRGVFASEDIPKGCLIELCHVIVIPQDEVQHLDKTVIGRYYYTWGHDHDMAAIALGHGSLYNHSFNPNARYIKNFETDTLEIVSLRDIEKGEEVRVNYNGDPTDTTPMWFELK